jgi:hypothetical protein
MDLEESEEIKTSEKKQSRKVVRCEGKNIKRALKFHRK